MYSRVREITSTISPLAGKFFQSQNQPLQQPAGNRPLINFSMIFKNIPSMSNAATWLPKAKQENRARALCILALVAGVLIFRWIDVYQDLFSANWATDFQYFWTAADLWANGVSPYGPEYRELGQSHFDQFKAPFFYPPNALPLLYPASFLSAHEASSVHFAINVLLLGLLAFVLTKIITHRRPHLDGVLVFSMLLLFVGVFMRSTLNILIYGQITIYFALAAALFIRTQQIQNRTLTVLALTVLLLKPQFGIPVIAYALARKETRSAAFAAVAVTAILALTGLRFTDPVGQLLALLHNMSLYTDLPENALALTGGLGYILDGLSLTASTVALIALLGLPPLLLGFARQGRENDDLSACVVLVWAVFAAPAHMADFIILAPIICCAFRPELGALRYISLAAMLFLARSWEFAGLIFGPEANIKLIAATGQTFVLGLLLYALLRQALWRGHKGRQGQRPQKTEIEAT